MKLSELAALVAAMQVKAQMMGNANPTVEFYDENSRAMTNMTVAPRVTGNNVQRCMVTETGSAAALGDFAIPLVEAAAPHVSSVDG